MTQKERRDHELPYIADEDVLKEMKKTRKLLREFNMADPCDFDKQAAIAGQLIPHSDGPISITQPFYCDYGTHIHVGKKFLTNYNCTILDVGKVYIGDNVLFGPNVAVYTAGHPIHPETRNTGYEYGISVKIGNNVWVGGNTVIAPGVTIGDNVVIGAGSIVTKDLPANVVAAGNPCRVIRKVTEEDKKYYYRNRQFDIDIF